MVVEDNGVGFNPPASVSGHGLGYMSELAKQLGGELKFERLQPGSQVRLTFRAGLIGPSVREAGCLGSARLSG